MDASSARKAAVTAYLVLVAALGAGTLASWYHFVGFRLDETMLLVGLVLAALCAAARLLPVSFGRGRASFDVGGVPIFAALILGGPACALLAAIPSAVHRDPSRAVFMGATHVLQVLAGFLAFSLLSPDVLMADSSFSAMFAWGVLAAGLVFFGLDALIGPVLMRLKYGLSWPEVLGEVILPALPSDALAVAASLATALAVASFGPPAALVLLSGAALSLAATNLVREHRKKAMRLEAERDALEGALRSSHAELAARLIEGLGSRDGRAAAHAAASAVYAYDVAREMGLGDERSETVRLAAGLMDLGLLWVPDEVLLTHPDKLNSLGKMRLEEHPQSGERVLSAIPGLAEAARWVRWHHERPDGAGYPDRLRGGWIPLEAKILAAASLYASLILDDPYTPALHPDEARRRIVGGMGQATDEMVAKTLLRMLDSEDDSYARASDARFKVSSEPRDRQDVWTAKVLPENSPVESL